MSAALPVDLVELARIALVMADSDALDDRALDEAAVAFAAIVTPAAVLALLVGVKTLQTISQRHDDEASSTCGCLDCVEIDEVLVLFEDGGEPA